MTSTCAAPSPTYAASMQTHQVADFVGLQELTLEEMDQVHGGFGPGGAVVGAIVSGAGSYLSGGNAGQIASAAIFGGVAGFFGGLGGIAMQSTGLAVGLMGAYTSSRPDPIKFSKAQR